MMKIGLVMIVSRGFSKSLGKRIAGNLQLCDLLVLISRHCSEHSLGKCKCVFLMYRGNVYHWLVFVHGVETGLVIVTVRATRPEIGLVKYH